MPQSIIIYRNPLEAAFWDLFMSSALTFPIITSVVVFVVAYWFIDDYVSPLWLARVSRPFRPWVRHFTLVMSLACAVATFLMMV